MNEIPIPPAVTLYWQEMRIRDLEAAVEMLNRALSERTSERDQLESLLHACQKALKEMQAQRDKAREGKR